MKEEYKKNLKHGYIFLIITLLIPFTIALSYEIHLNGGINLTLGQNEEPIPTSYPVDTPIEIEGDKVTVIIRNLSDGYKTKETSVTLVGLTQKNNEAWVNGNKVNVAGDGQFELKIDLAEGENKIEVVAKNKDGEEAKQSITVIREVEKNEEPKVEPTPQYNPPAQSNPQPQPAPVPMPTPTPTPEPQPTPITGLKLSCSITNTAPTSGSTVSINCTVKDQNNNGASGAFGYVTLNWKTGSSVYTLSQSDGGGNMSTSFTVPSGNTGSISGNVQASKDGLNINSNFNLNVQ